MQLVELAGRKVRLHRLNTLVVGSGAAGLNAAARLHALGARDVALLTEGMSMGTSRNTGSDKQTYYKLTLAGPRPDSVREMAQTLFSGGATHGDTALVEAALSARCFHRLVELGVPFPQNRFGEFVGYKTDHDPRQRATSAGPLTSRLMTEALEREVRDRRIPVFDSHLCIAILTDPKKEEIRGALALDLGGLDDPDLRYVAFNCRNIVYATGGPAGMYAQSVYPHSQTGATGIALEAGARAQNLTESQFGLASLRFRWNVSGTYQQVLPRYVSTAVDGSDEREFLGDYFDSPGAVLDAVFLKGYQWPFDVRKAAGRGSSLVDLAVHHQTTALGRRVFMDFRRNPLSDGELDFGLLGKEARSYLEKSGALFGRPMDRLAHMNQPAVDLYRSQGIDLRTEPLEVAVCNQHANGGLAGDHWWQSNLAGLFPVGEVNGNHGVYRPGGSALNSGQVGSTRAAIYVAARRAVDPPSDAEFLRECGGQLERRIGLGERLASRTGTEGNLRDRRLRLGRRMSTVGGILRSRDAVSQGVSEARADLAAFADSVTLSSVRDLPYAFQYRDLLISQIAWLESIADYLTRGGGSRGSYLVLDPEGTAPNSRLEGFRFRPDDGRLTALVQSVSFREGECLVEWETVRSIPEEDDWFENVWRASLKGENIR